MTSVYEGGLWFNGTLTSTDFNRDGCDDFIVSDGTGLFWTGYSPCYWVGIGMNLAGYAAGDYSWWSVGGLERRWHA